MNGQNNPIANLGPWARRANDYVRNNQADPASAPCVETVRRLLAINAIGINQRRGIQELQDHLASQGFPMSREGFQHNVLIPLKDAGVVTTLVYPGPRGGVFIPREEGEVREVAQQLVGRVVQELSHLSPCMADMPLQAVVQALLAEARTTLNRLSERL